MAFRCIHSVSHSVGAVEATAGTTRTVTAGMRMARKARLRWFACRFHRKRTRLGDFSAHALATGRTPSGGLGLFLIAKPPRADLAHVEPHVRATTGQVKNRSPSRFRLPLMMQSSDGALTAEAGARSTACAVIGTVSAPCTT